MLASSRFCEILIKTNETTTVWHFYFQFTLLIIKNATHNTVVVSFIFIKIKYLPHHEETNIQEGGTRLAVFPRARHNLTPIALIGGA